VSAFHPDLAMGRFIPSYTQGPRLAAFMNRLPPPATKIPDDVVVEDVTVPGRDGAPDVAVRLYRPREVVEPMPALLWIHGGGFIIGSPLQDERTNIAFVRNLGITVAAVTYRLSPEHPAPAALEDAYAALTWLFDSAEARGIDASRIAIGGASAGGGLAAGLALLAHDRGEVTPVFQLLVYPMLDDRTVVREDMDTSNVRVWTPGSNRYGWTSYLGHEPGSPATSEYAAPARRKDLSGLPPAWIGVGTIDLFHDEDLEYAQRLSDAGVPTEMLLVHGAFHGFDGLFKRKEVSKEFWRAQARALRAAFAAK
jgi:acetyl esterase/lipase